MRTLQETPTRIKVWAIKFFKHYEFGGVFLIVISFIAIVAGAIISYKFYIALDPFLKVAKPGDKLEVEATGMIGDFIGGVVGPILSFVGVLLFFLALRLQSKELGLQIQELAETRSVFKRQQFESTFFNLLKTQQDIRLNLEADSARDRHSRTIFEQAYNHMFDAQHAFKTFYSSFEAIDKQEDPSAAETIEKKEKLARNLKNVWGVENYGLLSNYEIVAKSAYKAVFKRYGDKLGHYFRNLYHILSYLKENEEYELQQAELNRTVDNKRFSDSIGLKSFKISEIEEYFQARSEIEKRHRKYAAFVQAQMSSQELFLLFYNALFFPKMKALMHHYDFLENLNSDDLLDSERDKQFYYQCEIDGITYDAVALKSKEELLKI